MSSKRQRSSPSLPPRSAGRGMWQRFASRSVAAWKRLLETPTVWLIALLLVGTWCLSPARFFPRQVAPATIADRDFVATEELLVPDEETTLQRQQRAREAVPPVYDFDPSSELDAQLEALAAEIESLGLPEPMPLEERAAAVAAALEDGTISLPDLKLTPDQARTLTRLGLSQELRDRLGALAGQATRRGIVSSKQLLLDNPRREITLRNLATGDEGRQLDLYRFLSYPDEVRDLVEAEIRDWPGVSARQRGPLADFLVANLRPNLHLNSSETRDRREQAAAETATVFTQIRKGQMIVRKGDAIDAVSARLINTTQVGDASLQARVLSTLGAFLFLALVAFAVWLGERGERVSNHSRARLFSESLLLLLISVVGAKLGVVTAGALADAFVAAPLNSILSHTYTVPFAAFSLCCALLLNRTVALILAPLNALLVGPLVSEELVWPVLYTLAGSLAAIYAVERFQIRQRLGLVRVGLVIGAVNVVVILLLRALAFGSDANTIQLGFDILCGFAGGLLAAAVASFVVPILESALGIPTDIKLAELANTNLPLLRRLAFEAPGSFQHSMMVANLAKQACEAIGADASLAHTAGLYHDIGKVLRPEYFIENQHAGHNPHDSLQPSMSVLVLISHVKDGLELAREHHLPPPILDAIEQHHGTRLIKFFYNRAVEKAGSPEEVREEEFRYPGPKPKDRVNGVLMLADAIEAASRTLRQPSTLKIRGLIDTLVNACLEDGQLDHTGLTLTDLKRIREEFLRLLTNIFHQRVDYPGFDFNAVPGGTPPAKLVKPKAKAS